MERGSPGAQSLASLVLQPSAALFEACCSDRIQPFDDEEEEDIWEDEETRCTARVVARARCGAAQTPGASQEGQACKLALDTALLTELWARGGSGGSEAGATQALCSAP